MADVLLSYEAILKVDIDKMDPDDLKILKEVTFEFLLRDIGHRGRVND